MSTPTPENESVPAGANESDILRNVAVDDSQPKPTTNVIVDPDVILVDAVATDGDSKQPENISDELKPQAGNFTDKAEEAMEKTYKFYESSSVSSQHHQKVEDSRAEKMCLVKDPCTLFWMKKRDKEWEMDMMADDFDVKSLQLMA
ncbi:hypothetical protein ACET3Z_010825 [Daucus carota]